VIPGFVRLLWVHFYESQDMRDLFKRYGGGFISFGGFLRESLFDHRASAITRNLKSHSGKLIENTEFIHFAITGASGSVLTDNVWDSLASQPLTRP
jgi:hypothetical protein